VVNLSPAGSVGSHWVGLTLFEEKVFYFDSLGQKCKSTEIQRFLFSQGYKSYDYLKNPIQNIFSQHCGYFVMSYFICLDKGYSIIDYLSLFQNASLSNDKIVKKIVVQCASV
jgi:hypothetical protein